MPVEREKKTPTYAYISTYFQILWMLVAWTDNKNEKIGVHYPSSIPIIFQEMSNMNPRKVEKPKNEQQFQQQFWYTN